MPSPALPGTTARRPGHRHPRAWIAALSALGLGLGVGVCLAVDQGPARAASCPAPGRVTGDVLVHDPSTVRRADGTYLVASTAPGIALRTSTDRIGFSNAGRAFPNGVPWTDACTRTSDGDLWAPDLSHQDGRYLMYCAASVLRLEHLDDLPGHQHHRGTGDLDEPGHGLLLRVG